MSAEKFLGKPRSGRKVGLGGGVIEAFDPDGVDEWGLAPPRFGGNFDRTDEVMEKIGRGGAPVVAGQEAQGGPVVVIRVD